MSTLPVSVPGALAARAGTLEALRLRHHPNCFVGRPGPQCGLGVHFLAGKDETVEARVSAPAAWEGFPGLVHGGIIASLLDGAMVNALFARGTVAVTAELTVRYWEPLPLGQPATVVGQVVRCEPPLYLGEARIVVADHLYATARGKFMRIPNADR
jgi:uncharacterized protein (TIGR00369 family)